MEARDYPGVLKTCLAYLHEFGGAVLKYPYSAGGKGARIMLNTWDVKDVYDGLMKDYKDAYSHGCGKKSPWPPPRNRCKCSTLTATDAGICCW